MFTLGISGGFDKPECSFLPKVPVWLYHDAGAAIFKDKELIAAVEQERFNRIKNTTKFPIESIRYCLNIAGIGLDQVKNIGYYFKNDFVNEELNLQYIQYPSVPIKSCEELLTERFREYFSPNFNSLKLTFVQHHLCHAYMAYYQSGFNDALVCIIDGQGEKESISLYSIQDGKLHFITDYSDGQSLGSLYLQSIRIYGYYFFDEYKVMGLAPYGDPSKYRHIFQKIYRLLPDGKYEYTIPLAGIRSFFLRQGFIPRRKHESFNQDHKDFAAALQETLEILAFHVITCWKEKTNHKNLCIAGGVGHNCTLNGLLAYSGLFEKIFVHPAASDPGAAIGAAMYAAQQKGILLKSQRIQNVYWGPSIGNNDQIKKELIEWSSILNYEKREDIAAYAARCLANGAVIGWVQGNLEFGPRALGNRSIIADPRPAENKSRINAMIKKREAYRPFAPSILEEEVGNYFELPACDIDLDFMVFNLKVKKDKQKLLGAITHVNGTGRVQTVNQVQNPKYWNLIYHFQKLTGIPVILNTSFNNRYEPIICSERDAIACFLTTDLDYLIIGDYIIEKQSSYKERLLELRPILAPTTVLKDSFGPQGQMYEISNNAKSLSEIPISEKMYSYLRAYADGKELDIEFNESFIEELMDLWSRRLYNLYPVNIYLTKMHQKNALATIYG
jgi:predicted NodU family carbamoyl transferase